MADVGEAVRAATVALLAAVAAAVLPGSALAQSAPSVVRAPAAAPAPLSELPLTPPQDGVWYEIFVRSFQDSDGDGVGDLRGVTMRLPYLAELGITGIWLMPIHPSPSYHGYDVSDYRSINPEYGTLADFEELLDAAHDLGIRVIIDFVPNHSSSSHPWFEAALAGDPHYRAYYVWSDDPPDWRGALGGSAWHEAPDGSSYLGLFSSSMPDLDHRNQAVVREFEQIAAYWLELGVDGFRIDAIQHIVESADGRIANTPENYAWVERFQSFVSALDPEALLVGETWTEMPAIVRYHQEAGLAMSFDYPLWRELLAAMHARSAADLAFTLQQALELYPADAWRGTFLGNHDQVRHATQFSLPRRDERRLKLAASLLLSLPGTPFLYYGEEIGMTDGPGSGDVEKRTPMRWEPVAGLGFTSGTPWTDPGPGTPGVSVAEQRASPSSLWWHYRRAISLRRLHPALDHGTTAVVDAGSRPVLAFTRTAGAERLLVLANLSNRELEVDIAELSGPVRELITAATHHGGAYSLPGLELRIFELE